MSQESLLESTIIAKRTEIAINYAGGAAKQSCF